MKITTAPDVEREPSAAEGICWWRLCEFASVVIENSMGDARIIDGEPGLALVRIPRRDEAHIMLLDDARSLF